MDCCGFVGVSSQCVASVLDRPDLLLCPSIVTVVKCAAPDFCINKMFLHGVVCVFGRGEELEGGKELALRLLFYGLI